MSTIDMTALLKTAKSKASEVKSGGNTIKANKPQNKYVLLPGWEAGAEHKFWHDFGLHFIRTSAAENAPVAATYMCLDKTYGKLCPVCQTISEGLRNAPDGETEELMKGASASQQYLLNVIELDGSNNPTSDTPQILQVGKSVFGQILDLMEDWGEAIFAENTPQVVQINKEGTGLTTKYTVQPSSKKTSINTADVMSRINNLADFVAQESEERMAKAITAVQTAIGFNPGATAKPAGNYSELGMRTVGESASPALSAPAPNLDDELDDLLGGLED